MQATAGCSPAKLSAGNNAVKALFPVENFWESTTGVLSEIDSEKRKIKIDFCFVISSTIHPMAVRSFDYNAKLYI
jgi:hypothetical protein